MAACRLRSLLRRRANAIRAPQVLLYLRNRPSIMPRATLASSVLSLPKMRDRPPLAVAEAPSNVASGHPSPRHRIGTSVS